MKGKRHLLRFTCFIFIFAVLVLGANPAFGLNVVAMTDGNGVIVPGGGTVASGAEQVFTITPDPGYIVDEITLAPDTAGSGVLEGNTYTFTAGEGFICQITVTFKEGTLVEYTITASAGNKGSISPSGSVTAVEGETPQFTITPDSGYVIDDVTVDDASVLEDMTGNTYTFPSVTADHTIHATFKEVLATYTITGEAGDKGSISPTETTVDEGDTPTFTFTPDSGYVIDDVTVGGTSVLGDVTGNTYTFPPVSADQTIRVTFKEAPPEYTISATSGDHGSISPAGDSTAYEGDTPTFTFTPDTGYMIDDVTVDGTSVVSSVTGNKYTFPSVGANQTLHVTFKETVPTYTITATAGSHGSISPSGTSTVNEGDTPTFTFTPSSGYAIDDVTVAGTSVLGDVTGNKYSFPSVSADQTLHVTFEEILTVQYTVTGTSGENGSISPESKTVGEGDTPTFTFTPDAGYIVEDVTVDGVSVMDDVTDNAYTFAPVHGEHIIRVTFKNQYAIIPTSGENGSISPSGQVLLGKGSSWRFTMNPVSGYEVEDVEVDGNSVGPVAEYTFTDVSSDHEISVRFKPSTEKQYVITVSSGENGDINPPPGAIVVNEGASRRFTIAPDDGYAVEDVLVDGVSVGPVPEYILTNLSADHQISVTFKLGGRYTIKATSGSHGGIEPSGTIEVKEGVDQKFTMYADYGYTVENVFIDGDLVGAMHTYTFSSVSADHEIHVVFRQNTCVPGDADGDGQVGLEDVILNLRMLTDTKN